MSESRICAECGSDTWKAAGYDELREARDRHYKTNREQAITILDLRLKVAELEARERGRQRKVHKQAAAIRRLEERLRGFSAMPYEGIQADASPVAQNWPATEPGDDLGPSPRGMRRLRKNRDAARAASTTPTPSASVSESGDFRG